MKKKRAAADKLTEAPAAVVLEPKQADSLTMIDNSTKPPAKCSVCGEECAPNSNEGLCWVCRRLKISAWRDSDPQLAAQE
ncbi:MAG: hypothetical protein ABI823_04525 [Bryobacteraceae bacterium]